MKARIALIVTTAALAFLPSIQASDGTCEPVPPPLPEALRELALEFREMRRDFLGDRQQLLLQLKAAGSSEDREVLIQQFREQHRDQFMAARELRRELHRRVIEIRRERRRLGDGLEGDGGGSGSGNGG